MKTIIATDGSDFSKAAIAKFCEFIGNPKQLEIKIISIYESLPPVFAGPYAFSADYNGQYEAAAREEAKKHVAEAEEQLRNSLTKTVLDISTRTLMGIPGQFIVEIAEEWNADLVVVGTHGYGAWSRLMLGSTSDSIVHHAPCSVLVVRDPKNAGQ